MAESRQPAADGGSTRAIRPFRADDVEVIASIWRRAFVKRRGPTAEAVGRYFHDVFLGSPWRDETLPSLVYCDRRGRPIGFVGVMPRRMRYRGRPLRVAVATQLMIDPLRPNGFAAFELVRAYMRGPQDLCLSDGATELSHRLWLRLGGEATLLY